MSIEIDNDNEEAYWFVRWVQMRRKYKVVLAELNELKSQKIGLLSDENASLKSQLASVKEDYQPKRVYKGRKKRT